MPLREDILYEQMFGDIPDDQVGRIAYILGKKVNNAQFNADIKKTANKIKRIKMHKISFTMWKVMKPAARPRANTRAGYVNMYVPRARENGDWFENFYKDSGLPHIDTPCKLYIKHYEKTPSSFNIKQKVLAELGLLRPYKRTADFDNIAKAVADCMQHGMLEDDCLVISSTQDLYYSIKPHVDITIEYMDKFPEA